MHVSAQDRVLCRRIAGRSAKKKLKKEDGSQSLIGSIDGDFGWGLAKTHVVQYRATSSYYQFHREYHHCLKQSNTGPNSSV